MRKVIEIEPALHAAVQDLAHEMRCKLKDLGTVLLAYALEHKADAIHEADRLLTHWESQDVPTPQLHVVRITTPRR